MGCPWSPWVRSRTSRDGSRWQGGCQAVTPRLGQDKPDFVRRRVRKLLTAGVVSALACMVKSENPALTSSCRELISRYSVQRVAEEAAGVLLANSHASSWEQNGGVQESGTAWALCRGLLGAPVAGTRLQLLWFCPQGVPGAGGGGGGPGQCGCTGRRQGEGTVPTALLACAMPGALGRSGALGWLQFGWGPPCLPRTRDMRTLGLP